MIATNGFLTSLECTKFVYSTPKTPSWFKGTLLLRERKEGDEERGRRKGGKGGKGNGGTWKKGEGTAPLTQISGFAPKCSHIKKLGFGF